MGAIESLAVLIPTLNEAENIGKIVQRASNSLSTLGVQYEIIVIDDNSSDNTAQVAEEAIGSHGKVIRRKGTRSLSLSILDGVYATKSDAIVVMDADASHPPELIPELIVLCVKAMIWQWRAVM